MTKETTFANLFDELKKNHLTPGGLITEVGPKKETITGLWLYCSPILASDGQKVKRVEEIVGDGFIVDFDPNKMEIIITKK